MHLESPQKLIIESSEIPQTMPNMKTYVYTVKNDFTNLEISATKSTTTQFVRKNALKNCEVKVIQNFVKISQKREYVDRRRKKLCIHKNT